MACAELWVATIGYPNQTTDTAGAGGRGWMGSALASFSLLISRNTATDILNIIGCTVDYCITDIPSLKNTTEAGHSDSYI